MTPLHIQIGIHYWVEGGQTDYAAGTAHGNSPAVREILREMEQAGMLKESHGASAVCRKYEPTDGLGVWIEALTEVPFPTLQWTKNKSP